MAEDEEAGGVQAANNESPSTDDETPPPVLMENDECGGAGSPDEGEGLDKKTDGEPRVIYVEFARSFPPEALSLTSEVEEAKEVANAEFVELRNYIHNQGFLRLEQSFSPSPPLSSDRARFYTLYFYPDADVASIAQALNDMRVVVHAIPARRLVPPSAPPGGPLSEPLVRPRLGAVVMAGASSGLDNQWYLFRCRINRAWEQGVSGKGVVIADIDWGFLTTHQDLNPRIKFRRNTIDDSDNVTQGSSICHGTAVLGIVGAANNGLGMAGVAFGADLWAIQAGEKQSGMLDPGPWCKAVRFVCDKDSGGFRKIIVLEVQTEFGENVEVLPPIRQVIKEAIASGIVVCVAAGNGSGDAGADVHGRTFPLTGSILVGATKYDEVENPISDHSNFGPRVTVYAPGDELHDLTCSSGADNGYRNSFGRTSGATPKVAGTVALMLEANPSLTQCEIKNTLKETGTPIKTDNPYAAGVFLNAERSVLEAARHAC
jgi:subtilisin family serine protease